MSVTASTSGAACSATCTGLKSGSTGMRAPIVIPPTSAANRASVTNGGNHTAAADER